MLRQRVITALVLMALLLPALLANSTLPFALFTLVAISAAGWEWARLNGYAAPLPALASGALLAVVCGACLIFWPGFGQHAVLWQVGLALWAVGGSLALRAGPLGWPRLPAGLRWALGLTMLWLAWAALSQARSIGVNFLLSVLCVVWRPTSPPTLPAGRLAGASWHRPSARARAGKGCMAVWPVCCCWPPAGCGPNRCGLRFTQPVQAAHAALGSGRVVAVRLVVDGAERGR